MRHIGILLFALSLLAGCAFNGTAPSVAVSGSVSPLAGPVQTVQTQFNAVLMADLQAANADAVAHGDTIASQCYTYLISVKQAQGTGLPVKGIVSGFQQLRDVDLFLRGSNVAFQTACGPLAMDVQNAILRGGAIGAGAVTMWPVISGLPAAIGGAAGASALVAGMAH